MATSPLNVRAYLIIPQNGPPLGLPEFLSPPRSRRGVPVSPQRRLIAWMLVCDLSQCPLDPRPRVRIERCIFCQVDQSVYKCSSRNITAPQKPVTDRFRLTPGPRVLQLSQSPPETRPIRQHAIQVSFSQHLPPTIYCGVSLTLLLRFCTVLTLTAISVFSINAGLNTSALVKNICRAGAGLLSFILKTYREC